MCKLGHFKSAGWLFMVSKRSKHNSWRIYILLPLIQDVFQLVVEVTSEEDSKSTKRVVITFPKTLSVTDSPSTVDVYKSDSISLSLRYKITSNCEAGMYGESCEHQCVLPRQQVTAGCKYSCNYLGDVVCVNEQPQVQMLESNTGEGVFAALCFAVKNYNVLMYFSIFHIRCRYVSPREAPVWEQFWWS